MGALNKFKCVEVATKAEAKARGLKHYFPRIICARGHISKRFVSDASCFDCRVLTTRKWNAENVDKVRKRNRAAYAADPKKFRARQAEYIRTDPVRKAAIKAAWEAANPGYHREWYAANAEDQRKKIKILRNSRPDVYQAHYSNRRALARNAEGSHCREDVRKIRAEQNDQCVYCRVDLHRHGHLDHIQPLSKGGSNWPENLQLLCRFCNISKWNHDPSVFVRKLIASGAYC